MLTCFNIVFIKKILRNINAKKVIGNTHTRKISYQELDEAKFPVKIPFITAANVPIMNVAINRAITPRSAQSKNKEKKIKIPKRNHIFFVVSLSSIFVSFSIAHVIDSCDCML